MSTWQLLGLVFIAGAVGGLINSCINDQGFTTPRRVKKSDGSTVILPGGIGNTFTGAVAASVSWLLYSSSSQTGVGVTLGVPAMTLATLGGAVLIGMAGTGWLMNAVNKNVSQLVSSQAAAAPASTEAAQKLLNASPVQALKIVEGMTPEAEPLPMPQV